MSTLLGGLPIVKFSAAGLIPAHHSRPSIVPCDDPAEAAPGLLGYRGCDPTRSVSCGPRDPGGGRGGGPSFGSDPPTPSGCAAIIYYSTALMHVKRGAVASYVVNKVQGINRSGGIVSRGSPNTVDWE